MASSRVEAAIVEMVRDSAVPVDRDSAARDVAKMTAAGEVASISITSQVCRLK